MDKQWTEGDEEKEPGASGGCGHGSLMIYTERRWLEMDLGSKLTSELGLCLNH